MKLPDRISVAAYDRLHDEPACWLGAVAAIAERHGAATVTPAIEGTALVGLVGSKLVLKVYPPFLRDHFEFECAVLARLHGRLAVPTPRLIGQGQEGRWPYLLMTQLPGAPLTRVWPALDEAARCRLLAAIGALAAQVHALPSAGLEDLSSAWPDFLARQRAGCTRRQRRTGLPRHLLAQLENFVDGDLPEGPPVILTGEYTPMNLLHADGRLSGLFDFGDGLLGPARYDWLGPLCFLAAGSAARCDAFLAGYGAAPGRDWRLPLLRLLLLHRYSCLPAQIAWPGWQRAASFEQLAEWIWP